MVMLKRGCILVLGLFLIWQCLFWLLQLPTYLFPSPIQILLSLMKYSTLLLQETAITFFEAIAGLLLGSFLGIVMALLMMIYRPLGRWMMPIMLVSQAIPTFAIAPIVVLWLGYGVLAKVAVIIFMLFFPVASSFYDGLRRTEPAWLEMANIMGATPNRTLRYLRIPAAVPALVIGLKVATAYAPIGAVVSEWVGASHGLGFLMLNANARAQTDLMFACLIILVLMSLLLFFSVDKLLKHYLLRRDL
jgi:putative hydroxymethylpyrimidine transport system permease protein